MGHSLDSLEGLYTQGVIKGSAAILEACTAPVWWMKEILHHAENPTILNFQEDECRGLNKYHSYGPRFRV